MRISPVLVAAFITFAPAARAETPGASAPTTAAQPSEYARSRYRLGVDAFKAGGYREAVDYFLEADWLLPSPALSYNIARAYEMMGDSSAALRWYRDFLRRAPAAEPDRGAVEESVLALEKQLAKAGVQQITVLTEPAGAAVTIDEKSVGTSPWTGDLPPGSHQLSVMLGGHLPETRTVELAADHATDVAVTLTPAPASSTAPVAPAAVPAPPVAADRAAADSGAAKSDGSTLRTVGWVSVGVGGAALGGALVFELLRRGAESDARADTTQVGYAEHLDTMESRKVAARVFLGVGLVCAAAGGVMVFLGSRESKEAGRPEVGLGCSGGACGGALRGAF